MTVKESLELTTFTPALEQLAAQIDNFGSDEKLVADAAVALCSGIVAMAVFQNAPPDASVGNWDGSLDDRSLSLYSATHQMVFTLENNMFQTAVLTGSSGNTWNVNRSEKGLHVQVVDATADSIRNRLIKTDGSIADPADISQSIQELKAEWQKIGAAPESSLPAYVPAGDFIDPDLPDVSSLPDVNSSAQDDDDPGSSGGPSGSGGFSPSGGPGSSGGSSSGGAPVDFGAFPFPKNTPDAGSEFAGKAANAAGNLLKGAAAAVAAGLVGKAVQSAARSGDARHHSQPVSAENCDLLLSAGGAEPVLVKVFPWVVGRGSDCQMVLASRLVSRKHANFILSDDKICFEDLGSSNGSWVNGEKPSGPVPIYQGDEIKVADVVITVVEGPQKPRPESGNLPTMMFSFPESAQKTGEFPAIKEPESVQKSPPPKPAAPPPAARSSAKPVAPPPPPPPPKPVVAKRPAPSPARPSDPVPAPPPPPSAKRPAPPSHQAPPPSFTEDSDEDFVAKAVQAARNRAAPPDRHQPPPEPEHSQHSDRQPGNAPGGIKPASPEDFKRLPSVRWVSFIFGFFFLAENIRALILTEGAIFEQQHFLLAGAAGAAMVFFAFIAGPDRGFFRFLTLVSSGVYVGTRLYHEHQMLLNIINHISAAADNPVLVLPLVSILTALWICKRAASR